MAISYPLINGTRHEWSSIELKLNGKIYVGVSSINYSAKLEPTKVYGVSPEPIGRTRGVYSAEGSIEMYLAEYNALLTDLSALGGLMEVSFDAVVAYSEADFDVITDEVIGCRIKNIDASQSQGADPLKRKLDLDIMKIKFGGFENVNSPLTSVPG